jgi:hypothetical protein
MAAADGAGVLSFAGRAVRQIVRHAVSERKCECHVEGCACCDWTGVQPEAPEGAAPAGVTAPIDPIYFMSKMLEGLAAGDADKSLAYARHYIEQLEASGSASQAKRLRDAMDGTARMVGLAAPAGAHCNDCTDPHCHGAAPAVSREAAQRVKDGTWPQRCEQRAFVEGAAWVRFALTGFTPFASERDVAEQEAVKRYGDPLASSSAGAQETPPAKPTPPPLRTLREGHMPTPEEQS